MKVGDLVWSKFYETYGIIVKDYGISNHHCVVLNGKQYSQRPAVSLSWAIGCEQSFTRGIVMNIGDLITHNPTGAVGTIIADYGDRVAVYWCVDGDNDGDYEEIIEKMFIENLKK